MRVQADELDGALVWRSAGFTVLHMLSSWTVPEGMAVSYKVHLDTHTDKHTEAAWLHTLQDRVVQFEAQSTSYLWPLSLFYVHVLSTDIRMNVFVWMDVVQHV